MIAFSLLSLDRPVVAQNANAFPRKIALIVAIGNYETNNVGWQKISSGNDIPLVKGALVKIGFNDNDIEVLKDSAATREGILGALKRLKKRAK